MRKTTNQRCTTTAITGYWWLMFRGIRLITGWIPGLFERALIHGLRNWLSDEFAQHEALGQRVSKVTMSAKMHGILGRERRGIIDWPKDKNFASCLWGADVLIQNLGEFHVKVESDKLMTMPAVSRGRLVLRGVVQGIAWHIRHFPDRIHVASFKNWLSNEFAKHETLRQRPTRITMNARTYSLVRKMGREVVHHNSDKESLNKGFMARLWGTEVWVRRNIGNFHIIVESLPSAE